MAHRLALARKQLRLSEIRMSPGTCPLCGPTLFVQLFAGDFGVRCTRCGAAQNTVSMVAAVRKHLQTVKQLDVLLNSQRGPLLDWANRSGAILVTTTYVEGRDPGEIVDGSRHEDLQSLSFDDGSFDLYMNQEIFEHVVDDRRAFREAHRVLKPAGYLIFTVPLDLDQRITFERAALSNGTISHFADPEYHNEPSGGRILAFRNYGYDVVDRLMEAGFMRAWIESPSVRMGRLGVGRPVVVARKGG
jgi:SAM-dependent methyltransferase